MSVWLRSTVKRRKLHILVTPLSVLYTINKSLRTACRVRVLYVLHTWVNGCAHIHIACPCLCLLIRRCIRVRSHVCTYQVRAALWKLRGREVEIRKIVLRYDCVTSAWWVKNDRNNAPLLDLSGQQTRLRAPLWNCVKHDTDEGYEVTFGKKPRDASVTLEKGAGKLISPSWSVLWWRKQWCF